MNNLRVNLFIYFIMYHNSKIIIPLKTKRLLVLCKFILILSLCELILSILATYYVLFTAYK